MLVKKDIVIYWMLLGLVLIFFQVIIGGITRLTGSGLSITKWEIVTGTIPPLTQVGWEREFLFYKETPQYQKINRDMSLSDFKFIYFWEYLHRLWARGMGIIFIVPFIIFIRKGWMEQSIVRRLVIVAILAGIVGLFGWIMVASGLIDRPWVNAYKLTIHLGLALIVYSYLLWTILLAKYPMGSRRIEGGRFWHLYLLLLCLQIFFGGLMSGMKAGLSYPTWPDMNGVMIPGILLESQAWSVENFVEYDDSIFMITLVQFVHRNIAYMLIISGLYLFLAELKRADFVFHRVVLWMFITLLICQVCLGIWILLSNAGSIPVFTGVLHQGIAIVVLSTVLCLYYFQRGRVKF